MEKLGPVLIFRASNRLSRMGIPLMPRVMDYLNRIVFACWVPHSVKAGPGFELGYAGLGIVIHGEATIGSNVHICQNVTIGGNAVQKGVPAIGDNVYIGVGACILGPVTVGQGAVIGAHSVVRSDVPPRSVVVGNPARIVKTGIDIRNYLYHLRPPDGRGGEVGR